MDAMHLRVMSTKENRSHTLVGFNPTAASAGMTLAISSTVFGETREIPLPPALANACNTMTPSCPVAAGQAVTQTATIPVSTEYHDGIPAQLRVTMTNAQGVVNTCNLINLVIH
ncbi:hypothetical protein HA402_011745 [Bradysia odoriphaga]|nr:hypothetical protein HA402_011745 [Bradysia odoriphaga]